MLKRIMLILFVSTSLFSDTTMCFKKNWTDPSTIEDAILDGGKCFGKKTLNQMKKDGWVIDDIKISSSNDNMNYIYILKKDKSSAKTKPNIIKPQIIKPKETTKTIDIKNLKKELLSIEKEKEKKQKIKKQKDDITIGQKVYTATCSRCHGKNAELRAYNTARVLTTLTLQEMETSIWNYTFDEQDNGFAILMKPYAESMTPKELKQVHKYIQTLK
jgi:mono/diheme cytochrome c family protein